MRNKKALSASTTFNATTLTWVVPKRVFETRNYHFLLMKKKHLTTELMTEGNIGLKLKSLSHFRNNWHRMSISKVPNAVVFFPILDFVYFCNQLL